MLLLPAAASASRGGPCFSGGPSVRVTADMGVEFKWQTNVSWLGTVEVFDNADGTGTRLVAVAATDAIGNPIAATTQDVTTPVGSGTPLAPDTTYYFRVTATDPSNNLPDVVTPTPLPSFFTGAQALWN